jgi:hypothetical protein
MNHGSPMPTYRVPEARPSCGGCGTALLEAPLFSPQGQPLCRACYHAGTQAVANARASQGSAGEGLVHFGNQTSIDRASQNDFDTRVLRKCAKCGAHAVNVIHVTFHYVNGITRGRTYLHRCGSCGVEFKTESVLRMITELFWAVVFIPTGIGAIFLASGWAYVICLALPLGLAMLVSSLRGVVARFRNPIVPRLGPS